MYYLQSRYYDPAICRFISPDYPDVLTATPVSLTDKNLYAYCDNNPVMRVDYDGMFWGALWDVFSFALSAKDVYNNPDDIWAWFGLIGDTIDLFPLISGVGEVTDVLHFATKVDNVVDIVDDIHDTVKIVDNSIDTYKALRKVNAGNGLEVHHIVEKRLVKNMNIKTDEMLSVALTREEHAVYTRAWRKHLPYGKTYDINEIWSAAQEIYSKQPQLLEAVRKTLRRVL